MDVFIPHINKIAEQNGFKNFELVFEKGSDLGFIGILNKCRIIENDKELSLYLKFLPNDEERNTKYNSFLLFEREVLVYKELFPIFEEFQKEHGIAEGDKDGYWSYPKCYYCNYDTKCPSNSIIIMDDLTVANFEVKDKFIPSDFQHTAKLFVELAKLHGLSLAISRKRPEALDKFKEQKNLMCFLMQNDLMKDIAPRNFKLIKKLFQKDEERDILQKLQPYETNLWMKIAERLDKAAVQPISVVCHGDVWINNVLYNYCDSNKEIIKDMKLVDWQMMHFGSFGSELTYYLYCCVDYNVRREHFNELIQLYYSTMREFLSKFGLNVEEIIPYDTLMEQLRMFGLYALGMVNFAIPLLCKYPERLIEDEKVADLTEDEQKCVENFNNVMRHTILEMIDMKIL